jgi:hypothetical protein
VSDPERIIFCIRCECLVPDAELIVVEHEGELTAFCAECVSAISHPSYWTEEGDR